jgi:hypothetical protein
MPWSSANRPVRTPFAIALWGTMALSACATKYAEVPPRVELAPYGRIALVAFSVGQGDTALARFATQRFAERILESQPGIELMELDAVDSSLEHLAASGGGSGLAQEIGRGKNVPAVFLGQLKVSKVKPSGAVGSSGGVNVQATVSAELTVRLLATQTGGTVWRSSSTAAGTVGLVSMSGGLPSVAVRDPEEAYGEVVRRLVTSVTRDFRPTWVKQ